MPVTTLPHLTVMHVLACSISFMGSAGAITLLSLQNKRHLVPVFSLPSSPLGNEIEFRVTEIVG